MSTLFPGAIDTPTSLPYPSATDDTNSPSLSSGQDNQNDALIATETKLGTGSSTPSGTYALVSTGTGSSAWSLATPASTIVGISDTQTLTNKTIDASNNTITNISGSDIASLSITATQIANATITATQIASSTLLGSNIATATVTGNNLVGLSLWGVGQSQYGTAPSAKTGQFYIQTGTSVVTLASNVATIDFPTSFPAGVVDVLVAFGDSASGDTISAVQSTMTNTSFQVDSSLASGTVRVNWIAIGF